MKDKKLSIPAIAVRNLKAKKSRTIFMMFFVILMSATFFFSTILMKNLEMGIENTTERMGADIIVVPREGTENMRESLFAGKPCTLFFQRDWEEAVGNLQDVERVSSQLYIATLSASCCDQAVQMIAIDPKTDFVVTPWLENRELSELKEGEVIIGTDIDAEIGDTITFYGIDFKVAGKLESTGMGYDNSVFLTFETAYKLKDSAIAEEHFPVGDIESLISLIMVDTKEEMVESVGFLKTAIKDALDNGESVKAFTADELMSSISDQVRKLSGYGNILTNLLIVSTALALISIFVITVNERKYEFGILYTLGAKKSQMTSIILSEALIISLGGGVIGVAGAYYLVNTFKNMISTKLDIPYFSMDLELSLPIAGICILIAVITGIIAVVCSAWKISKGEAYRLIRESE